VFEHSFVHVPSDEKVKECDPWKNIVGYPSIETFAETHDRYKNGQRNCRNEPKFLHEFVVRLHIIRSFFSDP
jgi:hypothetical protein